MGSSNAALDSNAVAEAAGASGIYRIWPGDGTAPESEGWTHKQSTMQIPWGISPRRLSRNVVVPTVTVFRPAEGTANGTAMIIAPGGAFHFLMVDHEGYDMARWLAQRGVTAFVLKYRLGQTPEADADLLAFRNDLQARLAQRGPLGATAPANPIIHEARLLGEEDGRQAIRFVRQHAADWGIDPQRIGIGGFSAGGGVTMGAVMQYDAQSRPDFGVCIYGAYRSELGVPADAPPLFIAISDDDRSVAPVSGTRLYEAWHTAGRPVELHVFGNGAHGWGMIREGHLSDPWIELMWNWLGARGLLGRR